jgi:hypothetical protein
VTETAPSHAVSPRDLRVSDAEREHIVNLLHRAIGRGLIDLDQFTERADIAYGATTRGQLNVALADLPGLVHPDAPRPGAAEPTRASHDTERASGEGNADQSAGILRLTGSFSDLTRTGRWAVPERVSVHNKYGNTKLDFTEAHISGAVVRVDLDCKWGSVELIVPDHAEVDANGVTDLKFGALHDKTGGRRGGGPLFVVAGRVHGGSLTIRHPRRPFWGC